jgi:hypothetical protein
MIQKVPDRVPTMSPQEEEYLQDIKGLIDFTIRNRLRFGFVTGKLAHDMRILEVQGNNLPAALAAGLKFHVMGCRHLTRDAFGVSEEEGDEEASAQPLDQNHADLEK